MSATTDTIIAMSANAATPTPIHHAVFDELGALAGGAQGGGGAHGGGGGGGGEGRLGGLECTTGVGGASGVMVAGVAAAVFFWCWACSMA